MGDQPGIVWNNSLYDLGQEFETCAVCAEGKEKGAIYGCIQWGHHFSRLESEDQWYFNFYATGCGRSTSLAVNGTKTNPPIGAMEIVFKWGPGIGPSNQWINTVVPWMSR